MIQITPQMRILLAVEPVDFRKGIDGLAALCRQVLGTDPLGVRSSCFAAGVGAHSNAWFTTVRGFGCAKSDFQPAGLARGPKGIRLRPCRWIRTNCTRCCGMGIRNKLRWHRCGGGSAPPSKNRPCR